MSCQLEEWPKVLLLSDEGPQMGTAGGILLYRLLQDYPPQHLRIVERKTEGAALRLSSRYKSLTTPWRRFEQSRFHRWKRSLRAFGLVPPVPLRTVDALMGDYKPEVVLSVMQHACYYDCALRYASNRHLPLVAIIHDVNEQFEKVYSWAVKAARRRDGEYYRYASRRLCISPEMESRCAQVYGVRGDVMYPNRGSELTPRAFEKSGKLICAGILTVGFVGNLNYGYGDELCRLLPAFREAGARLVVFSQLPKGKASALLNATDVVDYRGFAPAMEAWEVIKSQCDSVILPYPDSPGHLECLYRHHFPSKLPEYLALGMPVVVTGPEYATGLKWALQNEGAAMTWISGNPSDFATPLRRLTADANLRVALATTGYARGSYDFNPEKIKATFFSHIRLASRERVASTI